jgi:hypothetical protein
MVVVGASMMNPPDGSLSGVFYAYHLPAKIRVAALRETT